MNQAPLPPGSQLPPQHRYQVPPRNDIGHLRGSSTAFYVLGGVSALFSLIFLLYVWMGTEIQDESGLFGQSRSYSQYGDHNDAQARELMGTFMVTMGWVMLVIGETMAVLMLIAGSKLRKQQGHTFCVVISIITCLSFPFGTALGIIALIVLMRESVRELFRQNSAPVQT